MNITVVGHEVISFYIARAGRPDSGLPRYYTGYMRIRCAALVHQQAAYLDSTLEIAGAGKFQRQLTPGNDPVDIDIERHVIRGRRRRASKPLEASTISSSSPSSGAASSAPRTYERMALESSTMRMRSMRGR